MSAVFKRWNILDLKKKSKISENSHPPARESNESKDSAQIFESNELWFCFELGSPLNVLSSTNVTVSLTKHTVSYQLVQGSSDKLEYCTRSTTVRVLSKLKQTTIQECIYAYMCFGGLCQQ